MGQVYCAEDGRRDRRVALEVISEHAHALFRSGAKEARELLEARATKLTGLLATRYDSRNAAPCAYVSGGRANSK